MPPEPECSDKGWLTMLGWEARGAGAEVGADAEVASRVLMTMTYRSIKSWIASHRVKQLFVEWFATR